MISGRNHCPSANGGPQSLGIVLEPLQVVKEAKELAPWSITAEFAFQPSVFAERQLLHRQYGLQMALIERTKLCRFMMRSGPENRAKKNYSAIVWDAE